ncbi:ATP-dependent DNA ligase [Leptolyngbya sp. 'hensonii']|uniref:ATP-dependent DNA ligase n=1 Tax=Leptolyngbya sp. 'hensonii' TaxID=1922337 RepID=UPI0009501C5D|nr:ATP-dependent DNA ligase [Leptolyngbya sp. 'hensonii']OLP16828.1 ATP-dependent DNA ligase [Leptolyngbya sp. 'hensonii']
MKRFTLLFQALDAPTSTGNKVRALQQYFRQEEPANIVWALSLLLGKARKRLVPVKELRAIFLKKSQLAPWLFEACLAQVGDGVEVISLLLAESGISPQPSITPSLSEWMERIIPGLKDRLSATERHDRVLSWWASLTPSEVFVLNKILTGALRVEGAEKLVIQALGAEYGLPESEVAHRLMEDFDPSIEVFQHLIQVQNLEIVPSQPYPFFLAFPLEADAFFQAEIPSQWQVEWKWDGIRAQLIRRAGQVFLWSRQEVLITHQFPELVDQASVLPDGMVLDGEIVSWDGQRPMNVNDLQKRLGRKKVTRKMITETPIHFLAYDLLEQHGQDIRELPLADRRQALVALLSALPTDRISLSPTLSFTTFVELEDLRSRSREQGAEGLMLKALDSPYGVGRQRGKWWKYKVNPLTLDAVLLYAQANSGNQPHRLPEYTFALWQGNDLIPFARTDVGLNSWELEELDRWIRQHTLEKFGPVRAVEPLQVFEIAFEGIARSNRHKSGLAVRQPRILRWCKDKSAAEADTLQAAFALLEIRK